MEKARRRGKKEGEVDREKGGGGRGRELGEGRRRGEGVEGGAEEEG